VNHTHFPKEVLLPDWACWGKQSTKGDCVNCKATMAQAVQWLCHGLDIQEFNSLQRQRLLSFPRSTGYFWVGRALPPEVMWPGMCLTTYPHLASRFKNEWSYNSTPSTCLHAMYSNKLSFACVFYLMALTPPQCISHRVQVNNSNVELWNEEHSS
jgi:hypothetical protein